jgi:predicted CXXCH cytochrome family protein
MSRTIRTTLLGLAALTLISGGAWGALEGSKHDFSHEEWSGGELCGACHTPHRDGPAEAAPLWNPGADLNRTFGTSTSRAEPGAGTLSCLRCHDGTIASNTAPRAEKRRPVNRRHPGAFTSAHETSEHPVGVRYPQFGKGYKPASTVLAKGLPLPEGRVECVSCHDPHNEAGVEHMLVTSNARSRLCLTCHKK